MDIYGIVKPIMDKYGVPESVWKPAMWAESENNPKNVYITGQEASYGLFQINRKAHPQYPIDVLLEPEKNAEIAARDFFQPVLKKYDIQGNLGKEESMNLYLESIKPNRESGIKRFNEGWLKTMSPKISSLTGDLENVSDDLLSKLQNLSTSYGKPINVTSGYRSVDEQQVLWDKSDKSGKMVAPPGKSKHNSGQAVDLMESWVEDLTNQDLEKFGLYKPMDYEPWHIQSILSSPVSNPNLTYTQVSDSPSQNIELGVFGNVSKFIIILMILIAIFIAVLQLMKTTDIGKTIVEKGGEMFD